MGTTGICCGCKVKLRLPNRVAPMAPYWNIYLPHFQRKCRGKFRSRGIFFTIGSHLILKKPISYTLHLKSLQIDLDTSYCNTLISKAYYT
jgi:hypothetical protein